MGGICYSYYRNKQKKRVRQEKRKEHGNAYTNEDFEGRTRQLWVGEKREILGKQKQERKTREQLA